VVTANEYTDQVAVMLGFGGAAFAKPQLFDVADTPRSVVVDDFDGDGIDDIGVANMADDSITVLLALGHP